MSAKRPAKLANLVDGRWEGTAQYREVVDPLNGEVFIRAPETSLEELDPFVKSLEKVPRSGLHNPFKNPERYVQYGEITRKAAQLLGTPEITEYFIKAIQRVCPKSYTQAEGEVKVTKAFLDNFCGDRVRFLARGFSNPGNHLGQESRGYRWPYGPVSIIAPFNFPLEIPVLQLMGALYMGNKPIIKGAPTTSLVLELFVRLLHEAGAPLSDVDLIHCDGPVMNALLLRAPVRMTQFTGSSRVAEKLARELSGKVKIEDAGFDWKILGPDVANVDYVAWQADLDAYACSGQKCSAQSMMFVHKNWEKTDFLEKVKYLAERRKLADLTVGPVLTHTTENILSHLHQLLKIPGSKLLFGGKPLSNHTIPPIYGAIEPTAVFLPLQELLSPAHFPLATTEVFAPFQVVTSYDDSTLELVLQACERLSHHLTAAVVSNDAHFVQRVLSRTINGTTYAGLRARTTGAPQNHWFGPCGDPRGAGIGTPEAIQLVWSSHREVIMDVGPIAQNWKIPANSS
uniref:Aldehyde dehydrogenase domain-containing protein n=1 Tax=Arcella intermedia TaxID=1963864 RepID=A0A6B2L1I1_9EUKA|eukprot:TRINITY_DN18786_c0_g1_i1.p1 TRINITY_DN18786_c0_g1~~TRINITY_DN18786_c0_g1_i1.p1  ORF type:complete len:556 (-),score=107.38 TRINITY_DN18786_c0_g1_i1:36-1574(-)